MNSIPDIPVLEYSIKSPLKYSGQVQNGVYQGEGILDINNSEFVLEGIFDHGHFIKGKVNFKDRTYYEGRVSNKRAIGKGIFFNDGFSILFNSDGDGGFPVFSES